MRLVVIKMLGWIFNPGVSLDGRDFEFFGELNRHDMLGEWGGSIQEAVHSRNFPLALLLDLLLQLVILSSYFSSSVAIASLSLLSS
jgi:hypothetical protein